MTRQLITTFLTVILSSGLLHATHMRSGEIHVRQDNVNNFKVRITIVVYTNTHNTNVLFGGVDDILDFGDGSDPDGDGVIGMVVPETPNTPRPDLGEGIAVASFTIEHTYAAAGSYRISYTEPNRNEGIINMDGSVNTRFYTETFIVLKPGRLYRTPAFLTPPVFFGLYKEVFSRSLACIDSSNQLIYSIVTPAQNRDQYVNNYRMPRGVSINAFNGEFTWDMDLEEVLPPDPYLAPGEFVFAVKILQLHDEEIMGYIIRDFQIILEENPPGGFVAGASSRDENGRVYVQAGKTATTKLYIHEIWERENLSITPFSELINTDALTLDISDSSDYVVATLTFTNKPELVRDLPYPVVVRVQFNETDAIDVNYLFYTKDIYPQLPLVTHTEKSRTSPVCAYPNPFNNYIHLDIDKKAPTQVEVRDLQGNLIKRVQTISGDIDMSGANPGGYIFTILQNNGVSAVKAIKK